MAQVRWRMLTGDYFKDFRHGPPHRSLRIDGSSCGIKLDSEKATDLGPVPFPGPIPHNQGASVTPLLLRNAMSPLGTFRNIIKDITLLGDLPKEIHERNFF